MNKQKVSINKDLCIGCGTCSIATPEAFEVGKDGKAHFKQDVTDVSLEELLKAAQSCPTKAISIKDSTGKNIYPK